MKQTIFRPKPSEVVKDDNIYEKISMVEYLERIEKKVDEGNKSKKKYLKWLVGLSIIGIMIKLGADFEDISMYLDVVMNLIDLM